MAFNIGFAVRLGLFESITNGQPVLAITVRYDLFKLCCTLLHGQAEVLYCVSFVQLCEFHSSVAFRRVGACGSLGLEEIQIINASTNITFKVECVLGYYYQ